MVRVYTINQENIKPLWQQKAGFTTQREAVVNKSNKDTNNSEGDQIPLHDIHTKNRFISNKRQKVSERFLEVE